MMNDDYFQLLLFSFLGFLVYVLNPGCQSSNNRTHARPAIFKSTPKQVWSLEEKITPKQVLAQIWGEHEKGYFEI